MSPDGQTSTNAKPRARRASLRDVAERCGVSAQTVSRIVRGAGGRHDDQTRARVLAAAHELGYRPNASARATRSGRFGCISLVLSEEPANALLFEPVLSGVLDTLETRDVQLLVSRLPDARVTDPDYVPGILRDLMADGLLVNYNADIPEAMLQLIRTHALPAVWMNSRHACDCVHPDDLGGGFTAAELLLRAGHRRIAFVEMSPTSHYSSHDRREGYGRAMRAAGLKPVLVNSRSGSAEAAALLGEVTGVVAYGAQDALWAWREALRQGRHVPDDLSIVVFHDRPMSLGDVAVDTLVLPFREQGRTAAAMLLERVERPARPLSAAALPSQHAPGRTIRAPATM